MCGIEAGQWFEMYAHTHTGTQRIEWPDGGHYLGQVSIVVEVFDLIIGEIVEWRKEQKKNEQRH